MLVARFVLCSACESMWSAVRRGCGVYESFCASRSASLLRGWRIPVIIDALQPQAAYNPFRLSSWIPLHVLSAPVIRELSSNAGVKQRRFADGLILCGTSIFLFQVDIQGAMAQSKHDRVSRWYFGGLASAGAACCTHPLDLLKVSAPPNTAAGEADNRADGRKDLPRGWHSWVLQWDLGVFVATDSTTIPFYQKALIAGISGACGGWVGTPGDMVNVRMQNDMKVSFLAPEKRRNYKHAIDGVIRVAREEGVTKLFNGATMATCRAILMTIGQLSFYDQIKQTVIATGYMKDNLTTHFFSSFCAASIATVLTQPLDVMKTRMMNAPPGQFKGIMDCFLYTAKLGPAGFFKGFLPAWVRLAPHTVFTFIFFEQLRINFGYFRTTTTSK
uniref:Mitochondrial dicarboxylate carrier n=1 Tax=Ascaris lumbricoides TaxID=6252 RepID=A0A9J2PL42_ASCLU